MKKKSKMWILATFGFIILIWALLVVNVSYGEEARVGMEKKTLDEIRWKVGNITIEEAKIIRRIESLADRYKKADSNEKQKILDSMCRIYEEYQTTFLGIVLLNSLISMNKLNVLPAPQTIVEREFLTFAKLMQDDNEAGVLAYLSNIEKMNLGLKCFLTIWYARQKGIDNLPKELRWARETKVEQSKSQIRTQIKSLSKTEQVKFLFNIIENWEYPFEYEASIPLILEEHEKHPELVLSQLKRLFQKNIPNQVPPPYARVHTVFSILCSIAITINDETLIDIISPMADSANPYVAIKASEVLKWLREDIKYPLTYEYLMRAYSSRE